MNVRTLSAVAVALALTLSACGEDSDDESASTGTGTGTEEQAAAPAGPAAATVKLTESEFKIDPAQLQVTNDGVIEFQLKNAGSVTHALEVEGADVEEDTGDIAAGESASLKVKLDPGSYELYCPIDGHKDKGMTADLNVGLNGKQGGESEEEREREGGGEAENESEDSGESEDDGGY